VHSRDHRPEIFGLALGVYATTGQVVLLREALTVSGGNELSLGLSLAVWLLAVGIGAWLGNRLGNPGSTLVGASVAAGPILVGSLAFFRLHRGILGLLPGGDPSLGEMAIIHGGGLFLGAATVGFLFTTASRAFHRDSKSPASRLYMAEAVGALVAGLAFTFIAAGNVEHLTALGITAGGLAAGTAFMAGGKAGRLVAAATAVVLLAVSLFGTLAVLDRHLGRIAFDQLAAGGEMVAAADSKYGRLVIGLREDQYQLFSDGRISHVFPDPFDRPVPVHIALTQHPGPRRILLLGGGAPDRLEAALAHEPKQVVLTYLDEKAHTLSERFWSDSTRRAVRDPRVRVVLDDGRQYVFNTREKFDSVIVSSPPPRSGRENRYHTRQFFEAVSRILARGGTMSVIAPGGANVLADEAARAAAVTLSTVRSVFPHVLVVPGIELSVHGTSMDGVLSDDPHILARRFSSRVSKGGSFFAGRFESILEPSRVAAVSRQLDRCPARVNEDLEPGGYLANIQLWEREVSTGGQTSTWTWTGLAQRTAWIWLVVPLLIWAVWRVVAGKRRSAGQGDTIFSLATTGAVGMGVEVMAGIAAIIALFMAGLAVGALVGKRFLGSRSRSAGMICDVLALAFLLATGPFLVAFHDYSLPVAAWSCAAGLVTGVAFPVFLRAAAMAHGNDERLAAGTMESADHVGAAFGALVTGIVWLPVFGLVATSLMFAALKAASLIGQIVRSLHAIPAD
jgi:spermidine synthase